MNRKERRRREQLEKRAAKETPTMEYGPSGKLVLRYLKK